MMAGRRQGKNVFSVRALLATSASSLIVAFTLVSSAGATFPGTNGELIYSQRTASRAELVAIQPDNPLFPRQITQADRHVLHIEPSVSPSGLQAVFTKTTDRFNYTLKIFRVGLDGSGHPDRVTPRRRCNYASAPAFAPSNIEIAFLADGCSKRRGYRRAGLFTIRLDGTGLRKVPGFSQFDTYGVDWSPTDGSTLAVSYEGDIATVQRDGTGLTRLTQPDDDHNDFTPRFSPDGQTIAFTRVGPAPPFTGLALRTCVVNVNGSGLECVLPPQSHDAVFSPEGDQLAFTRLAGYDVGGPWDENRWELRTADTDGENEAVVSSPAGVSLEGPTWAPAP